MERLDLTTPNFTDENIQKLSELFPNCVTEGSNGKAIDFDALKQELSSNIIEGSKERYQLNWPGKAESLVTANTPINKTLRPNREESKGFDNTENLYIEGDNLEVLKLLQETYLGKIKMIYIDPPYNTGKDFVYKDNFTQDKAEYDEESGNVDDEGGRLVSNPDSNGRYHSDWLTMMYPRLKLARNLLAHDGVIFISIDGNETHNLKKLCDEIFGESNHVSTISNTNNPKGRSDDKYIATAHEYLFVVAKNIDSFHAYGFEAGDEILKRYNKIENNEKYREIDLRKTGDNDLRVDRPNLFYYFYHNETTGDLYPSRDAQAPDGYMQIKPIRKDGEEGNWRWGMDTAIDKISTLQAKYMPNRGILGIMEKDYLSNRGYTKATSSWSFKDVNTERGSEQFIGLGFTKKTFHNPKPIGVVQRCMRICMEPVGPHIILDFFSGSATTAHAVMQLNAKDGGKRKFIMAQIPEATDEKSEAYKAGYKTIAEIGKERIRRAGEKIKEDSADKEGIDDLDIGFRVLKVDSSNMKDVYFSPDNTSQDDMIDLASNIKDNRTDEDLLFMVLLDWGIDLSVKIERREVAGKTIYFADDNFLAACFADNIDENFVKAVVAEQPRKVVLRDSGFASSSVKINVEQIFKQADIEVKVI